MFNRSDASSAAVLVGFGRVEHDAWQLAVSRDGAMARTGVTVDTASAPARRRGAGQLAGGSGGVGMIERVNHRLGGRLSSNLSIKSRDRAPYPAALSMRS